MFKFTDDDIPKKKYYYTKEVINSYANKYRGKVRKEIIKNYGSKCSCCGENNVEFLAVDHVEGGGNEERKKGIKSTFFYLKVKKLGYPKEYRLLCHNCNQCNSIYKKCFHTESEDYCI